MFVTIYPESINAGAENGVLAGVFIPISDLPGLSAGEFAANQSAILKEGKAIYGLSNAIYSGLSAITSLAGITEISKGNPQGTGVNRFTEQIKLVFQWVADFSDRSFYPVPLNQASLGKASIQAVFPNASLVSALGAIPGEGLLFPNASANNYGSLTPNSLTSDARDWFYSLFLAMVNESTLRSSSVESAITNRTNLLTNRVGNLLIPANYYGTDAVTGLTPEEIPTIRIFTDTLLIEYECESNPTNQTLEVRIAYT